MDPELLKKLDEQQKKLDVIYKSTEKTRRYFMWTLIISIAFILLPLIGLIFLIPYYLGAISSFSGIGL